MTVIEPRFQQQVKSTTLAWRSTLSVEAIKASPEAYDAVFESMWGDPYEADALRRLRVSCGMAALTGQTTERVVVAGLEVRARWRAAGRCRWLGEPSELPGM